ncbi:MAG: Tad domain-containing protein [bacterium]
MNIFRKKKGQVFVIALVAMLVLVIIGILILEVGNVMYEKVHMQNIADSGAMEGGTWYARSLNLISASNKILVVSVIAGAVICIGTSGGALPAVEKYLNKYQDIQDLLAGVGKSKDLKLLPWMVQGAVFINGSRNDALFSIGLFNIENPDQKFYTPSFNLKRRTAADLFDLGFFSDVDYGTKKLEEGVDYEFEGEEFFRKGEKLDKDKYIFKKHPKIKGENVYQVWNKETEKFEKLAERRVNEAIEEFNFLEQLRFDIIANEDADHSMLVIAFKDKNKFSQLVNSGFLKDGSGERIKPGSMTALSYVKIEGGSMDFWDINGSNYTPRIENIKLPEIEKLQGAFQAISAAGKLADFDAPDGFGADLNTGVSGDETNILEDYFILH